MNKSKIFFAILIVLYLSFGCGTKKEIETEKSKAEAIAESYFDTIKSGDTDNALEFYSDQFFVKNSREESKSIFRDLQVRLGELQSYKLVKWDGKKNKNRSDAGIRWILQYEVTYSNQPTHEKMTIARPLNGDYKIFSHNIKKI